MELHFWTLLFPLILMLCEGKKDMELYCAVCRALIDEVNYSIGEVDPKKTLQVGSFRVDPNGDQAVKKVPFARSETHLTEVFESICEKFNDYAETTTEQGKKSVTRTSSRNNKPLKIKNISINSDKQKSIKFACDTIVEDHEEEMMEVLKTEMELSELESKVCHNIAELCTEEDLKFPMPSSDYVMEENTDSEDSDDTDTEGEETDEEDDKTDENKSADNKATETKSDDNKEEINDKVNTDENVKEEL